eukprot:TRINITY_DN373_c1_g1_i1.p1 TRINITY_DN373_c1_g1~~TRINITY_DN373_c1_g1_i1.p1  ORF type:complete len:334 (+),score=49.85 TRINITY_DN373_c1_g1_i1:47-1003(+)
MSESKFVPRARFGDTSNRGKVTTTSTAHKKDDEETRGWRGKKSDDKGSNGKEEEGKEKGFWQAKSSGSDRFTALKPSAGGGKRGDKSGEEGSNTAPNNRFHYGGAASGAERGGKGKKNYSYNYGYNETYHHENTKGYPEGQRHPIADTWSFSYRNRNHKAETWEQVLEQQITHIADVDSVESFWTVYSHLTQPSYIPQNCDYLVFMKGVSPSWEDPALVNGCRISIRLERSKVGQGCGSDIWEDILLQTIGAQWKSNTVAGAVISQRGRCEDVVFWLKVSDEESVSAISDQISAIFERYTTQFTKKIQIFGEDQKFHE